MNKEEFQRKDKTMHANLQLKRASTNLQYPVTQTASFRHPLRRTIIPNSAQNLRTLVNQIKITYTEEETKTKIKGKICSALYNGHQSRNENIRGVLDIFNESLMNHARLKNTTIHRIEDIQAKY